MPNRLPIPTILHDELSKLFAPLPAFTDETALAELGADAVSLITLSMAIEDEFGIVLYDRDVTAETTVGELCALVAREVGERE